MKEPAANMDKLLDHIRDKPAAMVRFAQILLTRNQDALARDLCRKALALAPDDEEVRALTAAVFSSSVPEWHFSIVRDATRNAAYDAALRRAVTPGCRVFEVGVGTGLLSMMAARAGAAEVISCEMNPVVAETARAIIARNGFSDRIRVVAKHSSDLRIGDDLPGPADVFVSEIVSNDLLGEGALPVVERTHRHLLKPGAAVIPARGAVRVALAEDLEPHRRSMGEIAGFDLSPFNALARPQVTIAVGHERMRLRSDPGDLFAFDFQSGGPFPEARAALAVSSTGGPVNGVAQWIRLDMDEAGYYENFPKAGAHSCWAMRFYPMMRPLHTKPGEQVNICGAHDRYGLRIWTNAP